MSAKKKPETTAQTPAGQEAQPEGKAADSAADKQLTCKLPASEIPDMLLHIMNLKKRTWTNPHPLKIKQIRNNASRRRMCSDLHTLVELTGVEPVSEKKAVRVSPGAVHLLKFPQCERVHTLDTLVASLIHDGLQSLDPCTFST